MTQPTVILLMTSFTFEVTDSILAGYTLTAVDGATVTIGGAAPTLPVTLLAGDTLAVTRTATGRTVSTMTLLAPGGDDVTAETLRGLTTAGENITLAVVGGKLQISATGGSDDGTVGAYRGQLVRSGNIVTAFDFTGQPDAATLGDGWSGDAMQVKSGRALPLPGSTLDPFATYGPVQGDQTVGGRIGRGSGLACRLTGGSGYLVLYALGSGALELYRVDNRSGLSLGSSSAQAGPYLNVKLKATGTRLQVLLDGVVVLEATDSAYTSGQAGIVAQHEATDPAIHGVQSLTTGTTLVQASGLPDGAVLRTASVIGTHTQITLAAAQQVDVVDSKNGVLASAYASPGDVLTYTALASGGADPTFALTERAGLVAEFNLLSQARQVASGTGSVTLISNPPPLFTGSPVSSRTDDFVIGAVFRVSASSRGGVIYNGTNAAGWGVQVKNPENSDGTGRTVTGIYGQVAWISSGVTIDPGQYAHVTLARAGGVTQMYINGLTVGSSTTVTPLTPAGGFGIGGFVNEAAGTIQSLLGQVAVGYVYEARWSATEVAACHADVRAQLAAAGIALP